MQTKCRFMSAAVSGSSNDSRSMTWHQWQAAYPTDSRIGRSSRRARSSASRLQGYQSTGLWAGWSRYGLVSPASRFALGGSGATASVIPPSLSRRAGTAHLGGAPRARTVGLGRNAQFDPAERCPLADEAVRPPAVAWL